MAELAQFVAATALLATVAAVLAWAGDRRARGRIDTFVDALLGAPPDTTWTQRQYGDRA